jgi:hypothetical protein
MATIQASDVLPVRSRISWSAVLAGAFIALTAYLVLMWLGLAVGLSLSNTRMSSKALAIGAGIWAIASMLVALFVGGCVCSRCTAGENKTEAAMGGVVVWGVVFAMLALLSGTALNTGLSTVFGVSNAAAQAQASGNVFSEDNLKDAGFTDEEIAQAQEKFDKLMGRVRNADERDVAVIHKNVTAAAWWALTGIVLSLAAAVVGGLVGAGPTLIITSLRLRGAAVTTEPAVTREAVVR